LNRRLARFILRVAALLMLVPLAFAQEPTPGPIHIYVGTPGRYKVPIAVPSPIGGHAKAPEFFAVVQRDLELSGWFDVIDPNAFIEPPSSGIMPGQFKFEDWEVPGAIVLAKGALRDAGSGQLRAEIWVYDVPGRRRLGARAFTVRSNSWRSLAHRVANEIIFLVTGQSAPFNTRFAYARKSKDGKEIGIVDFDGHGAAGVTSNGSINIKPIWSPSGSHISFTGYSAGNPDLYVADLAKGAIQRISSRMGINIGGAWSPDGGTMALTLSPDGNPDIYIIDPRSGKKIARLTSHIGIDVAPSYSPDGSRIAFVSERSGGAQVYVMGAGGGDVKRVTFAGGFNTDPVWSPDGTRIAFVSRGGNGRFDIFVVNWDGSSMTRVTQAMGDNEDPSWSPDGNYIAFSSTRSGGSHIWMSTADGSHQVQLTKGGGGFLNPNWSPSLDW
jgi:TolB protein